MYFQKTARKCEKKTGENFQKNPYQHCKKDYFNSLTKNLESRRNNLEFDYLCQKKKNCKKLEVHKCLKWPGKIWNFVQWKNM